MAEKQYVIFDVAKEEYGVPVEQVESIERLLPITRVPRTVSFVRGVMNLRGIVTPVIDVRERFHFPSVDPTDETRIIVVKVDNTTVGLVVDGVQDVFIMDESAIEPPPAVVGGVQAVYLHGIARRNDQLIVLLNLSRILSAAEEEQLKEVEKSVNGD